MALMRGIAKPVFEAAETDPKALDREFIERHTAGFEAYRALVEATPWEELVLQSGVAGGEDPRAGRGLPQVAIGDHRLVPGRDPARARRGHDPRDRQRAAAARQHRPRGRRPVPGPRPQQRAGQPHLRHRPPPRPRRGSPGWTRSAASTRRGSTGWTPSATIQAMQRRRRQGLRRLGGNFALAAPDTAVHLRGAAELRPDRAGQHQAQPQPPRPRPQALILPCLGRTEKDHQARRPAGHHASRTR